MSTPRPYSAPARDDARRATRRRIREEGASLFLQNGYVSTTLAAVAAAAGVSTRYVQLVFGSKAGLLSEVIQVAITGDDEAQPLAAREEWLGMLGAGGQDTLRAFAEINAEILRRSAGLLVLASSAAETDHALSALQTRSQERRLQDCSSIAQRLTEDGWLDPPTTAVAATDTIYVLSSPELYVVLCSQRRLAHSRYADWLTRTLLAALPHGRWTPGPARLDR